MHRYSVLSGSVYLQINLFKRKLKIRLKTISNFICRCKRACALKCLRDKRDSTQYSYVNFVQIVGEKWSSPVRNATVATTSPITLLTTKWRLSGENIVESIRTQEVFFIRHFCHLIWTYNTYLPTEIVACESYLVSYCLWWIRKQKKKKKVQLHQFYLVVIGFAEYYLEHVYIYTKVNARIVSSTNDVRWLRWFSHSRFDVWNSKFQNKSLFELSINVSQKLSNWKLCVFF